MSLLVKQIMHFKLPGEKRFHRNKMMCDFMTFGVAPVVASVLGCIICSIPCRTSCLVSVVLKETVEFNGFSKKTDEFDQFFQKDRAKQLARQGIEKIMPLKQTRRPLPCLLFQPFFYTIVEQQNTYWCNNNPGTQNTSC